eukprot:TRINITY_DN4003_c0_g1_i1.p1 TRINITY_DN4003_c0_g1~~TRINITY_DN4003_c0_g1_i1.p1  ORF type:complete len:171 (+),score=34.30 TRINITY_DN4003_c0_g1_i1:54-566(+)
MSKESFTITNRYYKTYFIKNYQDIENNDYYIHTHPNGLYIVGLSPEHFLLKEDITTLSLKFEHEGNDPSAFITENIRKKKRGKRRLGAKFDICTINYNDKTLNIPTFVNGFLVELNSTVSEDPYQLLKDPVRSGYISIIQGHPEFHIDELPEYLTFENYFNPEQMDTTDE